jgi:hypothetical protein
MDTKTSTSLPVPRGTTVPMRGGAMHPVARYGIGALALGATAAGALAIGALAIGAIAIGRMAVGELVFTRGRAKRVDLDSVVVAELIVTRLVIRDNVPPAIDRLSSSAS